MEKNVEEEIRLEVNKMTKNSSRAVSFAYGSLAFGIISLASVIVANGFLGDRTVVTVCDVLMKLGLIGVISSGAVSLGNIIASLVNRNNIEKLQKR